MMMKNIKQHKFILLIGLMGILLSCEDKSELEMDFSRLYGEGERTWKIESIKVDGNALCISSCELKNRKLKFTPNNLFFSTYTCLPNPCDDEISTEDGGSINWTKSSRKNFINVFGIEIELLLVSDTQLKWRINLGNVIEETYTLVPNESFQNRTQLLTGNSTKTWKYLRRLVNNVETPLTECLQNVRFINFSDGKLQTTYTNPACGTNSEGTWRFEDNETKYVSERPGSIIEFELLELTTESLVISYTNSIGQKVVLYQVPE